MKKKQTKSRWLALTLCLCLLAGICTPIHTGYAAARSGLELPATNGTFVPEAVQNVSGSFLPEETDPAMEGTGAFAPEADDDTQILPPPPEKWDAAADGELYQASAPVRI